jgi:hypothetical protein
MAVAIINKAVAKYMKEVIRATRRYEESVKTADPKERGSTPSTIEWKVIKEPNSETRDWEYRVITRGWKLSPNYQRY